MGGKSRKSGGVSKKLIDRLKTGNTNRSKCNKTSISNRKGFDYFDRISEDSGKKKPSPEFLDE